MSNYSEQKIVAMCDFSDQMIEVIVHAARIADILKKELCLCAIWKNRNEKKQVQEKLIAVTHEIKLKLKGIQVSNLVIANSLTENIDKLAEDYNAILIVLHQQTIKKSLKAFRASSIAFLFVNGSSADYLQYRNLLVPIDYRKASKETALWASYFGRFNKSEIALVYANETDINQSLKLNANINFIRRFLSSLKVSHSFIAGKTSSWGIFNETLTNSKNGNGDLLILAGSTFISFLDVIFGLPEAKIIKNAGQLPVLIINPRKDMYVLCD